MNEYKAGDRVLSCNGDAGTIREAWGAEDGYNKPCYYVTWDDGYDQDKNIAYDHEDLEPLTEKEN